MSGAARVFGLVEAGGTKFICALADETGRIFVEERFPTADPQSTLASAHAFLRRSLPGDGVLAAIGAASFGPVELDRRSARYGCILQTPKAGWSGTDVAGSFAREFACPIGFGTDVGAAAIAEQRWGAAHDVGDMVYLTIGTGIGGGILVNGIPINGLLHPEIGHLYPRRHPRDENFSGVCPFHGDCFEGLASGPAILARTGCTLANLDPAHPQWEIEADYLGQLCAQLVMTVSPRRIILGGGVMSQASLFHPLRRRMVHWLGGYIGRREILEDVDRYVVAPALGVRSGIMGALALAMDAASAAASASMRNADSSASSSSSPQPNRSHQ